MAVAFPASQGSSKPRDRFSNAFYNLVLRTIVMLCQVPLSSRALSSIVFGRNEGHTPHDSIPHILPDFDLELGVLLVVSILDVSHGDVYTKGRRRDAGCDNTYVASMRSVNQS
mgnify:FL=1